jgi:hypothetical protein
MDPRRTSPRKKLSPKQSPDTDKIQMRDKASSSGKSSNSSISKAGRGQQQHKKGK